MSDFYKDNPDLKFYLEHPDMKKIVSLKERDYSEKETYDFAPQNFEDAVDNYDKILEIVGEICGNTIASNAASAVSLSSFRTCS